MIKKTLILVLISVMGITLMAGCGLFDKMLSIKDDFQKDLKKDGGSGEVDFDLDEIIIDTPDLDEPVIISPPAETMEVLLYFASADGENLIQVEHSIAKTEGLARATLNALLEGPEFQSGLLPSVPAGTRLLDINVKDDGLCVVDFSNDLVGNMPGNIVGEELTVYAITNTLCQFPTVERVEFRVEGQQIDSLLGFFDLEPSVTANMNLMLN